MNLSEMEQALDEAEATLRRADQVTERMARMLIGRLRRVSGYSTLKELKGELSRYNARTRTWKEEA